MHLHENIFFWESKIFFQQKLSTHNILLYGSKLLTDFAQVWTGDFYIIIVYAYKSINLTKQLIRHYYPTNKVCICIMARPYKEKSALKMNRVWRPEMYECAKQTLTTSATHMGANSPSLYCTISLCTAAAWAACSRDLFFLLFCGPH